VIIAQEQGGAASSFLFFAILLVGLYLLAIRPQRNRAKALAQVQSSLTVGSQVLTSAGIYAEVVDLDGDSTVLEVAPGVRVRFARGAVVRNLDPAPADDPSDGPAA
jgi:preprotein translocase subunit YajC